MFAPFKRHHIGAIRHSKKPLSEISALPQTKKCPRKSGFGEQPDGLC